MNTSVNQSTARRLESGWIYQGPEAIKNKSLLPAQQSYAITLRRQLADRLATEAGRIAAQDTTPRGREWACIATACKREARRAERADKRLAAKAGVA